MLFIETQIRKNWDVKTMTIELPEQAVTHGGLFHADDVFASALLQLINPEIRISRSFEVPQDFKGLVFDIGGGMFDHHQQGAPIRENGVPYAAFGLLWRRWGSELLIQLECAPEAARQEAAHFDEAFIQPLDEDDNTGCGNQLSGVIAAFNPSWDSQESQDACFFQAVELARSILERKLSRILSGQRANALVEQALKQAQEGIVELPRFAPFKRVLVPSSAKFVVYPSQRGGYSAQVIPMNFHTQHAKCSFPQAWMGKAPKELQRISGLHTLYFCHKTGFLLSAQTLEDIRSACLIALQLMQDSDHED